MRFVRWNTVIQNIIHLFGIEFFDPFSHHHRSDAVTHQVGQRTGFGHKAVDTEDQRQARHRQMPDGGDGRRQHDEAAAVTPAAPFEESSSTTSRVI